MFFEILLSFVFMVYGTGSLVNLRTGTGATSQIEERNGLYSTFLLHAFQHCPVRNRSRFGFRTASKNIFSMNNNESMP